MPEKAAWLWNAKQDAKRSFEGPLGKPLVNELSITDWEKAKRISPEMSLLDTKVCNWIRRWLLLCHLPSEPEFGGGKLT